jgi:Tol biopolymer transport system component
MKPRPKRLLFTHTLMLSAVTAMFAARAVRAEGSVAGSPRACWSPDSSKVAFILPENSGSDRLYVADSNGSDARPILEGDRFQAVAWSPSGAHLAVASAPADAGAVVHVTDVGGAGCKTIELDRTAGDLTVGWSTDSTRIVLQSDRSILLIRLEDEAVESLDYAQPAVSRAFFAGSSPLAPDNKLLLAAGPVDVFSWTFGYRPAPTDKTSEEDDLHLWLVKVEGSRHSLPVMQYGRLAGPPVWTPNGRAIAFVTETPPEDPTIRRATPSLWMNMVGEVGTLLIRPVQVLNPISPTPIWSPAGTDVAYFWQDPTGRTLLNTVNAAFTSVVPLQEHFKRVLFAAWKEPATMFLVATTIDDDTICSTLDLLSSELTRLSTLAVPFDYLMPSPDLSKLLLETVEGKRWMFEIFDVSTGQTVQIAR